MEKLAYAIIVSKRKLRPYFEAHRLIIPTSHPLKDIIRNRESSPRISKWAAELAEYTVEFIPRTTTKSQVLADFVAEWTPSPEVAEPTLPEVWEIQCDRAYCDKGAGASAVITSPSGLKLWYVARLSSVRHTNNTAEYKGLLLDLHKEEALGARRLVINTDSELIAGQNDMS